GWSLGVYGLFAIGRTGLRLALRQWARAGRLVRNIVIVGAGEPGQRLIEKLRQLPPTEIAILGIFDDQPGPPSVGGVPARGNIDALPAYSREVIVDEVIVALPLTAENHLQALIGRLREMPTDLRLSLEPLANAFPIRGVSFHGEIPVIEVIDR